MAPGGPTSPGARAEAAAFASRSAGCPPARAAPATATGLSARPTAVVTRPRAQPAAGPRALAWLAGAGHAPRLSALSRYSAEVPRIYCEVSRRNCRSSPSYPQADGFWSQASSKRDSGEPGSGATSLAGLSAGGSGSAAPARRRWGRTAPRRERCRWPAACRWWARWRLSSVFVSVSGAGAALRQARQRRLGVVGWARRHRRSPGRPRPAPGTAAPRPAVAWRVSPRGRAGGARSADSR